MRIGALMVCAVVVLLAGPAMASDYYWSYQNTMMSGQKTAVAMRNGEAWPVIFSDMKTTTLLPTGWQPMGDMLVGSGDVRAISSPTGEVAAWNAISGTGVVSSTGGWQSVSAQSLAFDSQGKLWRTVNDQVSVSQAGVWFNLPKMQASTAINTMAIASTGEVGVAQLIGGFTYNHYSALTGWTKVTPTGLPPISRLGQMVFDNHDVPYVSAVTTDNTGIILHFDVPTASWQCTYVTPSATMQSGATLPLATDGEGNIGTAFVTGNNALTYFHRISDGQWVSSTLAPPLGVPGSSVGIAYDYEGLPVISYSTGNSLWLAYDPVAVPEPLSLTLLGLGGLALLRRR